MEQFSQRLVALPEPFRAMVQGDPIRDCCYRCGCHEQKRSYRRIAIGDTSSPASIIFDEIGFCSDDCYCRGLHDCKVITLTVCKWQRFGLSAPIHRAIHWEIDIGDEFLRLGIKQKRESLSDDTKSGCSTNRIYVNYLRRALAVYLDCTLQSLRLSESQKAKVHDRTMLLLVLLGGDAQVLLDFFAFLSSVDPEAPTGTPAPLLPKTVESKSQRQHPLLVLHGFFQGDSVNPHDCTVSAVYLLAVYRSLVHHEHLKGSFQAYQEAIQNPSSGLPPKIEAVNDTIASFLWSQREYSYGEALSDELQRIIQHIVTNKENGIMFLRHLPLPNYDSHASTSSSALIGHLSSEGIPQFMASALVPAEFGILREAPDFWSLYQDCFWLVSESVSESIQGAYTAVCPVSDPRSAVSSFLDEESGRKRKQD